MVVVRKLVSICLHYNIVFKAKHIPGVHKLVDALSRLQVHNSTRLAPAYMDPFPAEVSQYLQPQSWVT